MKSEITSGEVRGRRQQSYPDSAEREYRRVLSAYYAMINKTLKPYVEVIAKKYEEEMNEEIREDGFSDFREWLYNQLLNLADDFDDAFSSFKITKLIKKCGDIAKSHSIRDWIKLVKDTIGVQPTMSYYDELLEDTKQQWVAQNVSYVRSVPDECLTKLRDDILWAYDTRQPIVNLYRRLEKDLGVSKSKAKMIARDQMGTLSGQMARYEQESMGCTHYIWKTRRDRKVRECHRALDGTIQSWSSPPAMWYTTKAGIKYTGRYCHPSEDYMCRCTAIPIFDKEKIGAVMDDRGQKIPQRRKKR